MPPYGDNLRRMALKIERINARITRDAMRELRRQARAEDTSVARLIRKAVESWIAAHRPADTNPDQQNVA